MTTFATVDELQTYLGLSAIDEDRAELALEAATAIIQAEAQHRIFRIEDDVKKLRGTWASAMQLPEPPVEEVSAVTVKTGHSEETVGTGDYNFTRQGLLYRGSEPYIINYEHYGYLGGSLSEIIVTYTHGYAVVPGDIKALCLALAGRTLSNPGGAVQRETIGVYSYSNGDGSGSVLTDLEKAICRRYRTPLL